MTAAHTLSMDAPDDSDVEVATDAVTELLEETQRHLEQVLLASNCPTSESNTRLQAELSRHQRELVNWLRRWPANPA